MLNPAQAARLLVLLFALTAGAQDPPESESIPTFPKGFSEHPITGPIHFGTTIEFAPDGKLFVLEKSGTVEVCEWTNYALAVRFKAAAMGLPFLPARTMLGTDTFRYSGARVVTSNGGNCVVGRTKYSYLSRTA